MSDDESGYATAEDNTSMDVLGSPTSSTTKRQEVQMTQPEEEAPHAILSINKSAREKSVEPGSSDVVDIASTAFLMPSTITWPTSKDLDFEPNFLRSWSWSHKYEAVCWSSAASYFGSGDYFGR